MTDYETHKLRLLTSCAWNVVNACALTAPMDPVYRQACLDALLDVLNERDADGTPWPGRSW